MTSVIAGKIGEQLKALAALVEDQRVVPTTICNYSPADPKPSSGILRHWAHTWYTQFTGIHTQQIKTNVKV